jgi:uncharacterized protein
MAHIPQRTCIACRKVRAKGDLLRIIGTPQGDLIIDRPGREPGRGIYLCPTEGCLTIAGKQRKLERALGKAPGEEFMGQLASLAKSPR